MALTPGPNQPFSLKTFTSADGSGVPLSLANVLADVVAGKDNVLAFTLNGVVAGVSLKFSAASLAYGVAGSATVLVNAVDAAGDTLIGPGGYADAAGNPLTVRLTDADSSGATKLGETAIGAPGSGISFAYTGAALVNAAVTATLTGLPPATATIAFRCDPPASTQAVYVEDSDFANTGYAEFPLSLSGSPDGIVDPPGLPGYEGIAVDRAGRVYQLEGGFTGVYEYTLGIGEFCPQASGAHALPYRSVVATSSFNFAGDGQRDLYTLSSNSDEKLVIDEFGPDSGLPGIAPSAAPSTAPLRTITVNSPARLFESGVSPAVGTAGNDVFVTDGNAILGFAPSQAGTATAAVTIASNAAGLVLPASIAADGSGDVFVSYVGDWRADTPHLRIPRRCGSSRAPRRGSMAVARWHSTQRVS